MESGLPIGDHPPMHSATTSLELSPLGLRRLWMALGLLWLLAGVVLSLIPMPPLPLNVDYADKWQHLLGLGLMMLYAGMLFPRERRWAALGLLIYGIKIEMLQLLVPWRSAEWMDIVADALGIGLGWCLLLSPLQHALEWVDRRLAALT